MKFSTLAYSPGNPKSQLYLRIPAVAKDDGLLNDLENPYQISLFQNFTLKR